MALDTPLRLPEFPNPPFTYPQNETERAEWFASPEREYHLMQIEAHRVARAAKLGPKQTRSAVRAIMGLAHTSPL